MRSAVAGSEAIKRKRGLEDDEFYALRPWRSGDSKKSIHWRSSAKQGQPIVRQHDQPDNRDFALLLDLHCADPATADGGQVSCPKCETALSFAATVLLHLGTAVQGKIAIGVCGTENYLCRSRNHREIVDQAMQKLAVARPARQTRLMGTLIDLAASVSASTPLYIVSSRNQAEEFRFVEGPPADSSLVPAPTVPDPLRELRQIKSIWPLVRWIPVDSDDFRRMYSDPTDADKKRVGEIVDNWISENVAS
jgi:uncharacterized protein (DUF58 family)